MVPVEVRILVVAVRMRLVELVGLVVDRRFVHFGILGEVEQDQLADGSALGRRMKPLVAQLEVRV